MTNNEKKLNNFLFFKNIKPFWFILITCFCLYIPSLFFGFTYLDDNTLILDNQHFLSNFSNIFTSFSTDVFHLFNHSAFYYRPILTISLILDFQIGGISPFIYHLTNILLHIVSSYLVFVFLFKLEYKKELAFLFATIFLVHPVLTQAVSWIPGRNDSLLMVFVLSSFIFLIDYLKENKKKYLIFSLFFVLLSFFTKESGILLIPISLFFILFIYRKFDNKNLLRRVLPYFLGSIIILIWWFFLRRNALEGSAGLTVVEMFKSLLFNSPAVVQFIGKIFLPFNLSVLPIMGNTTFLYGIISIIFLLYLIFKTENNRWSYVLFGALWFFTFLLPSFIRPNSSLVADFIEHRVYVPIVGIFIILLETSLFKKIDLENKKIKNIFITILLLFSLITFFRNFVFANKTNFWENAARNSPDYPLAHRNLGAMKFLDGDYEQAEKEFMRALELNPYEEMAHNNLGLIYANRGEYERAEKEYKKELEINPYYDNAYFNLGLLYFIWDRKEDAVSYWKKTLEVNPTFANAIQNLSVYYYQKKDYNEMSKYVILLDKLGLPIPEDMLKSMYLNKTPN